MAKAKLSKGLELFGEHLLLQECRRSTGTGEELVTRAVGRRMS